MSAAELAQQYVQLTTRALETQWRLARDYTERSARVVRGKEAQQDPADWLRSVGKESAAWWRDAAKLGLSFGDSLLELNTSTAERLLDGATTATRLSARLSGAPGATASTTVTVANARDTQSRVSFSPGPLTGSAGATAQADWTFTPATLTLAPGQEGSVTIALALADDIPPGTSWTSTVAVSDSAGVVLEVDLTVDVS